MTRRHWMLHLGGATILSGFSGADLSAAAESAALPPGLYGPSLDHLAHSLKLSASPPEMETPRFFSAEGTEVLRQAVAAMLDWDDSKAPVPEITAWVELKLSEAAAIRRASRSLSPAHRALAIAFEGNPEALKETDTASPDQTFTLARFRDTSFLHAGRDKQIAALETWEREGDPSILWLKRRVIEGFYTSREGLAELNYRGNAFYPESPGCGHPAGS